MQTSINFHGQSGRAYSFDEIDSNAHWVHTAGVAVFAARAGFGWRLIKIAELSGRDHDVRPIWAFHDAQRYGADTVLICAEKTPEMRRSIIEDIEAGLTPVTPTVRGTDSLPIAA